MGTFQKTPQLFPLITMEPSAPCSSLPSPCTEDSLDVMRNLILTEVVDPAIYFNLTSLSLRNFTTNSILFVVLGCKNLSTLEVNDIVPSPSMARDTLQYYLVSAPLRHLTMSFIDSNTHSTDLEGLLDSLFLPRLESLHVGCTAFKLDGAAPAERWPQASFLGFLVRVRSAIQWPASSLRSLFISRYRLTDQNLSQIAEVLHVLADLSVDRYINEEAKFLSRLCTF